MDPNNPGMSQLDHLLAKHQQMQERSALKASVPVSNPQINVSNINTHLYNNGNYNPYGINPNAYSINGHVTGFVQNGQNSSNYMHTGLIPHTYYPNGFLSTGYNINDTLNTTVANNLVMQNTYRNMLLMNSAAANGYMPNYYIPNGHPMSAYMTPQVQMLHHIQQQQQQQQQQQSSANLMAQQLLMSNQIPQQVIVPSGHIANNQVYHQVPYTSTNNLVQNIHQQILNSSSHLASNPTSQIALTQPTSNKVYVNPYYTQRKATIHVNPHVQVKTPIHINPKVLQNTGGYPNQQEVSKNISKEIQLKLLTMLPSNKPENSTSVPEVSSTPKEEIKSEENITSSEADTTEKIPTTSPSLVAEPKLSDSSSYIVKSKTKIIKKNASVEKSANSSFITLSKQKIVRIKKKPRTSSITLVSEKVHPSVNKSYIKKITPFPKSINMKRNLSNLHGLVSIDGVMYKKSRNKLVRSNSSVGTPKRKRSLTGQYYIAKNGKKLLKLDSNVKKMKASPVKLNVSSSFISPNKISKNYASNKVKQRSLLILRNKMRKNNQPCLFFQRFGYCKKQVTGSCTKVHNKKQVAVCQNFLQGKCLKSDCLLSHDVGPEKMPTCRFFLEGCCNRDSCPYSHVKQSSKSAICVNFLQGFCSLGNECQKRHEFLCPEFDKSGSCTKGKCPYPHKSKVSGSKKVARKKCKTPIKTNNVNALESESKKRYYEEASEDLEEKKNKIMKQVQIIKDAHLATMSADADSENSTIDQSKLNDVEDLSPDSDVNTTSERAQRPPIGDLPSYIPID
ncbi:hypothetical protein TKK_0001172 [Trichogramma kaykai]|uniref:Zinc finger CCCH domain-containing protein 3 n=1 Tax=Trichogramma kaykai TaxID=54128 RepID=A0ABD2WXA1_9HYME